MARSSRASSSLRIAAAPPNPRSSARLRTARRQHRSREPFRNGPRNEPLAGLWRVEGARSLYPAHPPCVMCPAAPRLAAMMDEQHGAALAPHGERTSLHDRPALRLVFAARAGERRELVDNDQLG